MNDDETISYLINSGSGISRIGNSELAYLVGHTIRTQKQSLDARRKLATVLRDYKTPSKNGSSFVLGAPIDLALGNDMYGRGSEMKYWKGTSRFALIPVLNHRELYASAHAFRVKEIVSIFSLEEYVRKMLQLFSSGEVIYVGPNDLVSNFLAVEHYVEIPSSQSFSEYEKIRGLVEGFAGRLPSPIILITAGVMGTVLAAELNERGFRALDVGQVFRHLQELGFGRDIVFAEKRVPGESENSYLVCVHARGPATCPG